MRQFPSRRKGAIFFVSAIVAIGLTWAIIQLSSHGTCFAFEGSSKAWLHSHTQLSREVCEPFEKLVKGLPGGEGSVPSAELVHY